MTKKRATPTRHQLRHRYGLALASVAVAVMMIFLRGGPLAELNIRLLLLSAVMLSSWYGGLGPGILTTILAGSAIYFYLPQRGYLVTDLEGTVKLVEFVVAALLITFLNDKRRKAQTRAEAAQREAEAAARAKDEFLTTVSHELKTPLSAVIGWTDILLTKRLDGATSIRALQTIQRNARKQLHLIEDLLDVSRTSAGQFRLRLQSVDIANVIEASIDVVRPAIEAKGLQLQTFVGKTATLVTGDEQRLQQVIWNLLANAVKFTPAGGLIEVRLEHSITHALIVVKDTGEGIAQDFLPHVFERFRQADATTTRPHDGLGLGLAIARHLVELHGGTIEARSAGAGKGAQFTIQLPLENLNARLSVDEYQISAVTLRV